MKSRTLRRLTVPALTLILAWPAGAQTLEIDTIPGRFDFGKMWTFEDAPADYFSETYGFDASPEWFERVRLSVLRVPGCSASFVSPEGLVATNHHCIRGRLSAVERAGESLLDHGFHAASLEEERRIPNYHTDQLIAIEDVSAEIHAAVDAAPTRKRGDRRESGRWRRCRSDCARSTGTCTWRCGRCTTAAGTRLTCSAGSTTCGW
jgi:hypothetical protein